MSSKDNQNQEDKYLATADYSHLFDLPNVEDSNALEESTTLEDSSSTDLKAEDTTKVASFEDTPNTDYDDDLYPIKRRNQKRQHQRPNNKTLSSVFKWIGYFLLVLALLITGYAGYMFHHVNSLLDSSYAKRKTSVSNITMTKKPISILIMGIDNTKERNLDTTRTDSLIVCTFNPKTGKTEMVSIPRDTYVTMTDNEGYKTTGKINSAYSIDQEDGTIRAVEKLLDIPIDYYVRVDFNALEDVVNAFGGINLDVPFTLTEQDANGKKRIKLTEGNNQTLNGEQALAFARTRHVDNDIQRGVRQQEVISAIVNKAMQIDSMSKYAKVLQSLEGHIKTDIPKSVLMGLAKSATDKNPKIQHYQFEWASFNYNGESYVALNEESLSFIRHRLRVSLNLDKKDERDESNYEIPKTTTLDPSTYPSYGVIWDN